MLHSSGGVLCGMVGLCEVEYAVIRASNVRSTMCCVPQTGDNAIFSFCPLVMFHYTICERYLGERTVKEVYLKNISDKPVDITSPLLDPTGPFCILNAFRRVEAGALHRIAISFAPIDSQPFFEPICLGYHGNSAHLKLLLVGRGIPLKLVLEGAEGGQLDFGHTLAGDTTSKKVKVCLWLRTVCTVCPEGQLPVCAG